MKKFLAIFLALTMCVSLGITAFAAPEDESTTAAESTSASAAESTTASAAESTTASAAESTSAPAAESTSAPAEESTSAPGTEPSTEEQKKDILALVMAFLQSIKFDEVKDILNDISEALGFPRVETVADIAAFADAVVEKLGEAGLSYEQIVNMIKANDLIEWLEGLFKKPATTLPAADDENTTLADAENGDKNPDTGVSAKAAIAAAATVSLAAAVLFVLKKREEIPAAE